MSRRDMVATMLAVGATGSASAAIAPTAPGPDAVTRALARLLGADVADRVEVRIAGERPDGYTLSVTDGRIRVAAGSPFAAVRAVYAHLNTEGHAAISWDGDRVRLPPRLADRPVVARTADFAHRLYLNTCTFGYTTPFWAWPEWEHEIDLMAANGIDMPLALEGQEAIWQALWREQGLDAATLTGFFSGPAFLPWQRMGNIEGYQTPLPQGWIDAKRALQQRILTRMRELGMTPVLPAFAGYVPRAFAERHPNARIYQMRAWEGFRETWWLDPADPLFATLARRFLELQTAAYGPATHFLADAFNEMVPPIADDGSDVRTTGYGDSTANTAGAIAAPIPPAVRAARLAAYGERLYRSIADVVPGATWVMQGWLFGADKAFWNPESIAAFLSRVPDRRMLVLDIGNDRYPGIWRKTDAFGGKRWAYGYVHNYGGSNPVYGDLDFYRRDIAELRGADTKQLSGVGMFPEGLHSNWIVYAHNYDLAYGDGEATLDAWLARYLRARYGRADPALLRAWQAVVRGAFSTRYWTPRWWGSRAGAYLFFKRPTAEATNHPAPPGNAAELRRGIEALLGLAGSLRDEPLFVRDLTALAAHHATLRLDETVKSAVAAYRGGRATEGTAAAKRMRAVALAIDALLRGQRETLAGWLGAARGYGRTEAERAIYVKNARLQVTIWGGEGNLSDYASKAWAGMYRDYYLPRWTLFLSALGRGEPAAATLATMRRWERNWCDDPAVPAPPAPPADPIAAVAGLMRLIGGQEAA